MDRLYETVAGNPLVLLVIGLLAGAFAACKLLKHVNWDGDAAMAWDAADRLEGERVELMDTITELERENKLLREELAHERLANGKGGES